MYGNKWILSLHKLEENSWLLSPFPRHLYRMVVVVELSSRLQKAPLLRAQPRLCFVLSLVLGLLDCRRHLFKWHNIRYDIISSSLHSYLCYQYLNPLSIWNENLPLSSFFCFSSPSASSSSFAVSLDITGSDLISGSDAFLVWYEMIWNTQTPVFIISRNLIHNTHAWNVYLIKKGIKSASVSL